MSIYHFRSMVNEASVTQPLNANCLLQYFLHSDLFITCAMFQEKGISQDLELDLVTFMDIALGTTSMA